LKPGQICNQHWKGDTHCDPENNHAGCNFDGGDCCGPTKKGQTRRAKYHFCQGKDIEDKGACTCLDPRMVKQQPPKGCNVACFVTKWAGDGNCDDPNNTCGCNWDGGDCCGKKVNIQYCSDCECLDPRHKK